MNTRLMELWRLLLVIVSLGGVLYLCMWVVTR